MTEDLRDLERRAVSPIFVAVVRRKSGNRA
jgi:hypothetical protein